MKSGSEGFSEFTEGTNLTDEGNHQRVVAAFWATSSAAFSCKTSKPLLREFSVLSLSSLAPPTALLYELKFEYQGKKKAEGQNDFTYFKGHSHSVMKLNGHKQQQYVRRAQTPSSGLKSNMTERF